VHKPPQFRATLTPDNCFQAQDNFVMTSVDHIRNKDISARHTRLFELIRQKNLAEVQARKPCHLNSEAAEPPQHTIREFASAARRSLLPQEQQALGITASFGR